MITPKDTDLREALRRKYANVPQMKRAPLLTSPKGEEKKRRRLWPWAGAIAASIVLLIAFNYNNKVMPEQQPLVAEVVEQPVPEVPKVSENFEVSENSDKSEPSEPVKPKRTYKARKVSKPIEEPLLAEVEIDEDMEDPFLAIAEQMQDIRSRGEQVRQVVAQLIDNQVNLQ